MAQQKTLKELRSIVYRKLGDPAMRNPAYDIKDINNCINEAQKEISIWTHSCYAEYLASSVAEQQEYDFGDIGGTDEQLAERTIRVRFKVNNTTWTIMVAKTKSQLDEDYPNWLNASSGDPGYFWIHDDFLGFYPKPDASYTSAIWWEGFEKPPTLVNEGDKCELPTEYYRYVVDHAFYSYSGNTQALEGLEAKLRSIGQQHELRRVTKAGHISVKSPHRSYD